MPQAIAAAIIPLLVSAGTVGVIGFTGTAILALGLGYAVLAVGAYAVSALFSSAVQPSQPKVPKPEDGKYNLKQSVPSLPYVLGRVKKGGDYALLEEKGGIAYHIMVDAGHQIAGYVEHYLHDELVTLNVNGVVTAPTHFGQRVTILTRDGADASTAYANVVAALPTIWTADHRGDGLATVMMAATSVSAENYQKVFPQGMPNRVSVLDGALLYDPRTETTAYSSNIALMRLWHITHPVGGKQSMDDMYLPDWINAANVCDEDVTNRAGGTVKRYHGGFWFRANNNPVEVGRIMDQAAELVVYERPDGKIGVHAGAFVEPDVRLTENDIIARTFDANRRQASNVLAVRGRYTDPGNGFNTVDAAIYGDPYVDDTERTKTLENQAVQDHNHSARLQKLAYLRANAPRVTVVAHYEAAKGVPYRRFVKVHLLPQLDEAIIEVTGRPKLSLRNLTVEFEGIVVTAALYDFTAGTEEGAPGGAIIDVGKSDVPVPVGFEVVIGEETLTGGQTAAFALASWDFVSDAFVYELEWEESAGGAKSTVLSQPSETTVRTTHLSDGIEYRFRLRTWSGGSPSEWTAYEIETAIADATAPDPVTSVVATGDFGSVALTWVAPDSSNYFATEIYRNTVDSFGTASLVRTEPGAVGESDAWENTSLASDDYYYWLVAVNGSGVPAAPVPSGVVTVLDPVAPDPVNGVSGTGGAGQIAYNWTAPTSANYAGARIYWNTVDDFATATLAGTELGSPSAADSHIVSDLAVDTYYGWVVSINGDGVAATEVTTGPITVT